MADFDYYSWILLPVLIALARMCDVTLGTMRHIFMAKGFKSIVPILGFFEVLLWLVVMGQVMKNLSNFMCYIGWAGGFSLGTLLGMKIEERLALGYQVIRIITNQNCDELLTQLSKQNHGITVVDAQGAKGPVKLIFSVVKRKNIKQVESTIARYHPGAFYTLEDIKNSSQGVFKGGDSNWRLNLSEIKKAFPRRK